MGLGGGREELGSSQARKPVSPQARKPAGRKACARQEGRLGPLSDVLLYLIQSPPAKVIVDEPTHGALEVLALLDEGASSCRRNHEHEQRQERACEVEHLCAR